MRRTILTIGFATAFAAAPANAIDLPSTTNTPAPVSKMTSLPEDWLDDDLPRGMTHDGDTHTEVAEASGSNAGATVRPAECGSPSGTTGMILGAVAGGLLGNVIDGGNRRVFGTLAGAGGGALLGREIEKKRSARCN